MAAIMASSEAGPSCLPLPASRASARALVTASTVVKILLGAAVGALVTHGLLHSQHQRRHKRRRRAHNAERPSAQAVNTSPTLGDSERSHSGKASIVRPGVVRGVAGLIGNTPLMRIESLSELTGCEILGKAEFLNPAGSPKDRVALQILLDAEAAQKISPNVGDCVFEGTVGSTGISLATLCRSKGYRCSIVLPDDVASEKSALLEKLGAEVKKVRPRGIVDPRHFVNEARALASDFGKQPAGLHADNKRYWPKGFFADQFETPSNFDAHYRGTGPEIWAQCGGSNSHYPQLQDLRFDDDYDVNESEDVWPRLDAFVAGAGTGGTLSGVAAYFRDREHEWALKLSACSVDAQQAPKSLFMRLWSAVTGAGTSNGTALERPSTAPSSAPPIRIVLADPQGSGLFNKVSHGVMYSSTESEGTRRRHQVDSIVEGIGMNRMTHNLSLGVDHVNEAVKVTDEEAVRMSRWLSYRDGLFLGSSSAVNVVAAVKTGVKLRKEWEAQSMAGEKHRPTVVTILCDSGVRHLTKFQNDEVVQRDYGISVPEEPWMVDIGDILQ